MGLKTNDLDLDLQGQIGLENLEFCVMLQLLSHGNFTFKLELCIDHLKVLHSEN